MVDQRMDGLLIYVYLELGLLYVVRRVIDKVPYSTLCKLDVHGVQWLRYTDDRILLLSVLRSASFSSCSNEDRPTDRHI
jgi:hypothetical protein